MNHDSKIYSNLGGGGDGESKRRGGQDHRGRLPRQRRHQHSLLGRRQRRQHPAGAAKAESAGEPPQGQLGQLGMLEPGMSQLAISRVNMD